MMTGYKVYSIDKNGEQLPCGDGSLLELVFLFVQRCSAKHHFGGESGRITNIIDNGLLLIQGLHFQKENR
jgi:hypothetical protein